jgi:hypothetical protein
MIKSFDFRYLVLLMSILLSACQKTDIFYDTCDDSDSIVIKVGEDIIIDEDKYNAINSDEYTILGAYIEGDNLFIKIEYGGGCGTVEYSLITDGLFMESYPVQLNVVLSFNDDDMCESLVRKTTIMNLSNLADHYCSLYQNEHGSIIIHLEGFNETISYNF